MSAQRRDRLRAALAAGGEAEALLVTDLVNLRYLTGFTGSNGRLIVGPDPSGDVLLTDGRYETQAPAEVGDLRVVIATQMDEQTLDALEVAERCGFEAAHLPWREAEELRDGARERGVELVPVEDVVEVLREVKDADEVEVLRRACTVTVDSLAALLGRIGPGVTERQFARWLEAELLERGAEDRAFDTIIASGPNSAIPHHHPTDRAFATGDLIKVDFGARVDGYHADCTRTVALGEPEPELVDVHRLVVAAQAAAVDAARDGVDAREVDAACRDVIAEAGYGARFVHGTGHGVGLVIQEDPFLGARATGRLRAGMVITVEPGVYLPGRGGVRVEDTVAVAAAGPPEVLTETSDLPRDLLVL